MDTFHSPTTIAGVLLALALVTYLGKVLRSPLNKIPGPSYAKWTSVVTRYYRLKGTLPVYVESLHHAYGPIVRTGPNEVYTADPAAWQKITNVKNEFLKSPEFYWALHPGINNVLTAIRPDVHRYFRRLLAHSISESGLKAFIPRIESKQRAFIAGMQDEMKQRGAVDVQKWCLLMTYDTLTDLAFGESAGVLQRGEKDQPLKDIEAMGKASTVRLAFPELAWYLMPRFPIPPKSAANARSLREHAAAAIQRHQDLADGQFGDQAKPTLFSKLYRAKEDESLTFLDIRDNAQVYLTAGSHTTAITLTFLIWRVCRDEPVRRRLLAELHGALQQLEADGSRQGMLEYADVKDLPYLNCVIRETLRLHGAVPTGLPRVAPRGGATLSAGGQFFEVPEGTTVAAQAFSMHRNADAFPQPERWVPERWERPTRAMRDSFVPFGGGSRICIGYHLAEIQMRLATARFFHAFPDARVSQREGMSDEDMDPTMFLTLSTKGKRCLVEA